MEWPEHTSPIQKEIVIKVRIVSDSDILPEALFHLIIGKHMVSFTAADHCIGGQIPVEKLQKVGS